MLEGLEVSVLNFSEVKNENKYLRIDDDYFSHAYLKIEKLLKRVKNQKLISVSKLITDFGAFSQMNFVEYLDKGIPFLRNQDIKENIIDFNQVVYVSNNVYEKLSLKLDENDILIPRAGTLGNAAVILKEYLPLTANQNLAQIKPNTNIINPFYLSTFLCSKYGNFQINRSSTGNVQQWLNLENINNITIAMLSNYFQNKIESIIKISHKARIQSQQTYTQAEKLLLEAVGLQNFAPSKEAVNIKSFKESFLQSGRLDAEYYQPKYEEIISKISQFENLKICELVTIEKSIEPGSGAYQEEGIPFIRVSNLSKFGLSKPEIHLDRKEFGEIIKPKKYTILLSKDGSVGIAYKVSEDMDCITSGAILHLSVTNPKVNADYLTLD